MAINNNNYPIQFPKEELTKETTKIPKENQTKKTNPNS